MHTLSICIPTYHRRQFLKEALDSIIPQVTSEVEVVVSYTESSDGTDEMVAEYAKKYKFISFSRAGKDRGADWAFLKAAKAAKGKYIWLFSDDDVLNEGALTRVLSEIKKDPEIDAFHIGFTFLDTRKSWVILGKTVGSYKADVIYDSPDAFLKGERIAYSGYLPSIIMKKERWSYYEKAAEDFIGTAYVHMFILFCVLRDGGRIKCVSPPYILNRPFNDLFTDRRLEIEERMSKRRTLDIVGYDTISSAVFGKNSRINRRANSAVIRFFVIPEIIGAKLNGVGAKYFENILRLANKHYSTYPEFWLIIVPLSFLPAPLVIAARTLKRALLH